MTLIDTLTNLIATLRGPAAARRLGAAARASARDLPARLADAERRWPSVDDEPSSPVFVLSAGWRSGSTLVQRMVMSDPSTLIWGEPYARAAPVQSLAGQWRAFTTTWPEDAFVIGDERPDARTAWAANLYPPVANLRAAHRAFFDTLFAQPALLRGYRRWGFKEVHLATEHACYLRWLYPRAKFIFLYRNPYDAYASYKAWLHWFRAYPNGQVTTPWQFGRMWREMVDDFRAHATTLGALLLRYEDLEQRADAIAEYLGAPVLPPSAAGEVTGREGPLPWVSRAERFCLRHALGTSAARAGYGAPA